MEYIDSPIFYMGNKLRLLPQLKPLFPKKIDTFYDLFGGSGTVSLNVNSNKIVYNELNPNIYELFKLFKENDYLMIINHVENRIKQFNLPTNCNDIRQKDYKQENRDLDNENYCIFRKFYNKSNRNYLDLYTLTFFSFCNLVRFNKNSDFNMPFGNGCFNEEHKRKISYACHKFSKINIELKNEDALKFIRENLENFKEEDFIYLDPPYLNTTAIYNENRAFGGWNIDNDYEMFELLEKLNKKGIKWGMSNVFENRKIKNQHLIDWCIRNNWNINHLDINYSSLGKGNNESDEVYICNYKTDKQTTIFDFLEEEK